ncbi:hypothetical protein [Rhizobium giardinii]|uniref:hypothetical protein n=1 Tax=Rhizobium giardinii TaxID=56731 RepID=UPI003D6DDBAE
MRIVVANFSPDHGPEAAFRNDLISEIRARGIDCQSVSCIGSKAYLGPTEIYLAEGMGSFWTYLAKELAPHAVIAIADSDTAEQKLPARKASVWRSILMYALNPAADMQGATLHNLRNKKEYNWDAAAVKKAVDVISRDLTAAISIRSQGISFSHSAIEKIANSRKQIARFQELFPGRKQDIKTYDEMHVSGELETLANREVIFTQFRWLKGWIDWDEKRFIKMQAVIGFRSWDMTLNLFRADVHQKTGARNPVGFEREISLEGLPTSCELELWILEKGGTRRRWLSRPFWIDKPTTRAPSTPLLTGWANRQGNVVTCFPVCMEREITSIVVFQTGRCVGAHIAGDQQATLSGPVDIDITPSSDSSEMRLHIHVGFAGHAPVYWLSLNPDTGGFSGVEDLQAGSAGLITSTPTARPNWDMSNGERTVDWFINGIAAGTSGNAPQFDLENMTGRSLVEAVESDGGYHAWNLWRHCREGLDRSKLPALIMPPEAKPPVAKPSARPRVVVIRAMAAPTDDLYVLAPLQRLVEDGLIDLHVVDDLSDERGDEERAGLLSDGCFVIISRYLSNKWLETLLQRRHAITGVYYLMDDDVSLAEQDESLSPTYRKRMMGVAHSEFQTLLHLSSRFIVTSEFLAQRFRSAKTDLLTPPYIAQCDSLTHLDDLSTICIEYHGTQVHRNDLAAVAPALIDIHDMYPTTKIRIFMGNQAPRMLKQKERIEIVDGVTWDEYKLIVAHSRAHIALAPMLHTPYNYAKSFVKIHDHARLGAVGLYSNRAPYDSIISHGQNGFLLENDPIVWRHTLQWLIENPKEIARTALAAQDLAKRLGDIRNLEKYWRSQLVASSPAGNAA